MTISDHIRKLRKQHDEETFDKVIGLTPFVKQVLEQELRANTSDITDSEVSNAMDTFREMWFMKTIIDSWMKLDLLPSLDDENELTFSPLAFHVPDDARNARLKALILQYDRDAESQMVNEPEMWQKIAEQDRETD